MSLINTALEEIFSDESSFYGQSSYGIPNNTTNLFQATRMSKRDWKNK